MEKSMNKKESGMTLNVERINQNNKSWNWAAFSFPIVWGLFHGVYWPIGVRIAIGIIANVLGVWWVTDAIPNKYAITFTAIVLTLVLQIILGIIGNRIGDIQGSTHEKTWNTIGLIGGIITIISYGFLLFNPNIY